jgi:hypothetical protein
VLVFQRNLTKVESSPFQVFNVHSPAPTHDESSALALACTAALCLFTTCPVAELHTLPIWLQDISMVLRSGAFLLASRVARSVRGRREDKAVLLHSCKTPALDIYMLDSTPASLTLTYGHFPDILTMTSTYLPYGSPQARPSCHCGAAAGCPDSRVHLCPLSPP